MKYFITLFEIILLCFSCNLVEEKKNNNLFIVKEHIKNCIDSLIKTDENKQNKVYAVFFLRYIDYTNVYITSVNEKQFLSETGFPLFYELLENQKLIMYYSALENIVESKQNSYIIQKKFEEFFPENHSGLIVDDSFWGMRIYKDFLQHILDTKEYNSFYGLKFDSSKFIPPKIE